VHDANLTPTSTASTRRSPSTDATSTSSSGGSQNAFDEDADFPYPGSVVGEEVEVLSVAIKDNRRELIATCKPGGRRCDIALLDVNLRPDPATSCVFRALQH
jgi:hypothetical protein